MVRIAKFIKDRCPELADFLINSRYVDDMMDSKGTLEEIKKIARDGDQIFE